MQQQPLFIQLLERLINQKLQQFVATELTRDNLDKMHHVIKTTVFDVFSKCEFDLTEKSKLYVASRLFRGLTFNAKEDMLTEHAHARHINIKELPDNDLNTLKQLMGAAAMEEEIEEELKRRVR